MTSANRPHPTPINTQLTFIITTHNVQSPRLQRCRSSIGRTSAPAAVAAARAAPISTRRGEPSGTKPGCSGVGRPSAEPRRQRQSRPSRQPAPRRTVPGAVNRATSTVTSRHVTAARSAPAARRPAAGARRHRRTALRRKLEQPLTAPDSIKYKCSLDPLPSGQYQVQVKSNGHTQRLSIIPNIRHLACNSGSSAPHTGDVGSIIPALPPV